MIIIISTIIFAFLCGSIPTGYLIVKKVSGIDIRTKGSGNIGSTNVKRILGKKLSIITQAIDVIKGIIPVALAIFLADKMSLPISKEVFISIVAVVAVLGHDYTPFLNFNGGKGVNTTLGAFVLLSPIAVFSSIAIHITLGRVVKIVSLRSIILGIAIPTISIILGLHIAIVIATAIAGVLLILRHKDNLIRMINKEEK